MNRNRWVSFVVFAGIVATALYPSSASARYTCSTTSESFSPPGGCNTDVNGDQLLEYHTTCTCVRYSRTCTSDSGGSDINSGWITCSGMVKPPDPPSPTYRGLDYVAFAAAPREGGAAPTRPKRIIRCANGYADIVDSSGNALEPVGPCYGQWSAEMPPSAPPAGVLVEMKGLHYPAINDCVTAKSTFAANFQRNVPLQNLCKAKLPGTKPASLVNISCTSGPRGSVVNVTVKCE